MQEEKTSQKKGGDGIKSKSIILLLFTVVVFSFSIIISAWIISSTGFTLRGGGVATEGSAQAEGIAVSGLGEITVAPDTVVLNVTARERASSAIQAQEGLNRKVNSLIDAIKAEGVKDDDISSSHYSSSYGFWWWDWDRERVVTQGFEVTLTNIDRDEDKLVNVIDAIIAVDAQTGWSLNFTLDDKSEAYSQARELAYERALQKGKELAVLSGVRLGEVRYISDQTKDSTVKPFERSGDLSMMVADSAPAADSSTTIPVGDITVSVELDVLFDIL